MIPEIDISGIIREIERRDGELNAWTQTPGSWTRTAGGPEGDAAEDDGEPESPPGAI
jgi:hypothetical protein